MPVLASVRLAPNFTAGELGADEPSATPQIVANLTHTAQWLQWYRGLLGVPLRVTSGYRTPTRNLDVGGVPTSDHPNGLAADVVPIGLSLWAAQERFAAAQKEGAVPVFDQLVYYPVDGHIHVGLGTRNRREVRIKLAEGGYPLLTPELATKLRASTPLLLLLLLLLILIRGTTHGGA